MENKCNSCFYALMDKDLEAPCAGCTGYSNYVKGTLYMTQSPRQSGKSHASETLKEAIDGWFSHVNGTSSDDLHFDVVSKPKHYMLFKYDELYKYEEGVEVRDVIEKLVSKFSPQESGMFISDYVQMMQYLMRFMDKNGVEDLKKARVYLNWLIEAYDNTEKA